MSAQSDDSGTNGDSNSQENSGTDENEKDGQAGDEMQLEDGEVQEGMMPGGVGQPECSA